jgi:FkbM family methyltransferase
MNALRTLWRRCQVFALEHVLKLPVVYTDEQGLRYVLYPGQNSQAYIQQGGNYEVAETRFCLRRLASGMTVVDVGANIGLYTLLFAKLVGERGAVHAFEPEAKNHERLATNVLLNRFGNVRVRHAAVYHESGNLTLNVFPDSVNSWHSLGAPVLPDPFRRGKTMAPESKQDVAAVSLDDYCEKEKLERIDLLKVDVEGAELEVFRGARRLLSEGRIDAILFEISLPQLQAMNHEPKEVIDFLVEHGMKIWRLEADGSLSPGEGPLARYQNLVALKASA